MHEIMSVWEYLIFNITSFASLVCIALLLVLSYCQKLIWDGGMCGFVDYETLCITYAHTDISIA